MNRKSRLLSLEVSDISLSKTWEELEEIQPITLKMIKNSIQKNRLAHAYLFEGMRGTGKRDAGIVLAKSLFCLSLIDGYKPCEECMNCKRINHGNHPDIHIVEPDGHVDKKTANSATARGVF